MAQEIKNTFLKSKMNKDLDDRILPNGEYRNALNISVGRSEDNDVGALENVIGNSLITNTQLNIATGLDVIGIYADDASEQIFVFLTNYIDPNTSEPTDAPSTSYHFIYSYSILNDQYTKLVEGSFLNFSKTNRIIGVNLLENLLFWTDNRNQPRQINIISAANSTNLFNSNEERTPTPPYYTEEHQISVAKYNPYQAIKLYKRIELTAAGGAGNYFSIIDFEGGAEELSKYIGAIVLKKSQTNPINGTDYIHVENVVSLGANNTRVLVSPAPSASITAGQKITLISSNMTNESSNVDWPGDPNFLEERFVRFSYRFKYDDNEYSLMAPFTQIAYVPTQKGYFIEGDEEAAYQSTIVQFMKNNIQNIKLAIPLPDRANQIARTYKIQEIEILFREADGTAVKVLESIPASVVATQGPYNVYEYEYQSRKPYKTLPEAQTVRVYDKVPVRAFSQETAGNRIIYGNYRDKHTPPPNLNYNCRISPKNTTGTFNNFIEYPNHSVKRNRNYQIGFVLSDKFGRQSPVLLSSVDEVGVEAAGIFYAGSSIYSPYDNSMNDTDVFDWAGDAILVNVISQVSSIKNQSTGTPGLYAIQQKNTSSGDGYAISAGASINNNQYSFTLDGNFVNNANTPKKGDYLRGEFRDFVEVVNVEEPDPGTYGSYVITTLGQVNSLYLYVAPPTSGIAVIKYSYIINDLGWYSYKIVVKQTQQDYYNAYLPGFLDGYPISLQSSTDPPVTFYTDFPTGEEGKTAHVVLINDNINKIPRDLSEVGPEQKQYRSSVKLYGRVNNYLDTNDPIATQQYFPRSGSSANAIDHIASTIASALELKFIPDEIANPGNFYQLNTNPYIARLATSETGLANPLGLPSESMVPTLTVYETEAQESLLPIYWETTSEGLIADLNADVLENFPGATDLSNVSWQLEENVSPGQSFTNNIYALSSEGNPIVNATISLESILRGPDNSDITNEGIIVIDIPNSQSPDYGSFNLKVGPANSLVYRRNSAELDQFVVTVKVIADGVVSFFTVTGDLGNNYPSLSSYNDSYVDSASNIIIAARNLGTTVFNGCNNTENQQVDIVFFMQDTPTNANGLPLWTINSNTGEITQVPFSTPEGIYNFKIGIKDAAGTDGTLDNIKDVTIIIRPPSVNDGIIPTTCFTKLDPVTVVAGRPNKCIVNKGGESPTSGIWYIVEDGSSLDFTSITPSGNGTVEQFRVGTEAHSRGTLSFTYNLHRGFDYVNGDDPETYMVMDGVYFYYRIAGQSTWEPLTRVNDTYNNTGKNNAPNFSVREQNTDQSYDQRDGAGGQNGQDGNQFDLAEPPAGDTREVWVTGMRVSNRESYTALDENEKLEYAVVIERLRAQEPNMNISNNNSPYAFITVEDLNYATCIPSENENALANWEQFYDGDKFLFKYFRSPSEEQSDDWWKYSAITEGDEPPLYSNIPYPEFVNQFFTDVNLTTLYVPDGEASESINYKIDDVEASSELQWAAVFAKNYEDEEGNSLAINGKKVFLLAGLDIGVGSVRTVENYDGEVLKNLGTLRYINILT